MAQAKRIIEFNEAIGQTDTHLDLAFVASSVGQMLGAQLSVRSSNRFSSRLANVTVVLTSSLTSDWRVSTFKWRYQIAMITSVQNAVLSR